MAWGSEQVPTLNRAGDPPPPPSPVANSPPAFISTTPDGSSMLATMNTGASTIALSIPPPVPMVATVDPVFSSSPGFGGSLQMVMAPPSLVAGMTAAATISAALGGVIMAGILGQARHYAALRGLYRIFEDVEYRFYRSNSGPPTEDDSPFATASSLPDTPTATFSDGTWWISVELFNGILRSGFLPLGPNGETYLRLDISGGSEVTAPPVGPNDWQLVAITGGVIKIMAFCILPTDDPPEEWAIAYTTNGSTPATDSPDITVAMQGGPAAVLEYSLPAQSHGITVKVRLQTRRDDGSWTYSEDSYVLELTVDTQGPTAPVAGERWPGRIDEGLSWA